MKLENAAGVILAAALLCWTVAAEPVTEPVTDPLELEVMAVENKFARTMAQRDHPAFVALLSHEAVFISGASTLRGSKAVADHWKAYFDGPDAPFSWAPEQVSVLDSGQLALSTGPVWDPSGQRVATYTSIWRRQPDGQWRIVFDRGNRYCAPPPPPSPPPPPPVNP